MASRARRTAPPGGPCDAGPVAAAETAGRPDRPLSCVLDLPVRPPFDGVGLAAWFAARAIPGVEEVHGTRWRRAVTLPHGPGVLSCDLAIQTPSGGVRLHLLLVDPRDRPAAIALARHLLDLGLPPDLEAGTESAPAQVAPVDVAPTRLAPGPSAAGQAADADADLARRMPALAPLIARRPGVRIPGTPTLAEALLWAITGQQISASQARDQIARATDLLAQPLPHALRVGGLHRLPVDPLRAAAHAEEWFRGPGARRRTLMTAIPAAPDVNPSAPGDIAALRAALLALPGIGPWTADYALLRAVRAPDLAPRHDAALLAAARDLGLAADHPALMRALEHAAPHRSRAVMHLWHHAASLALAPPRTAPPREPHRPAAPKETP